MRYLGIDFGLKRVGLAISYGNLASPWKVITGPGFNDLVEKIKKEAFAFDQVVVGLPEGEMEKVVKKLTQFLKAAGIDVVETDETLSSQKAISQMVELNIPKKKRKTSDAYSAAIILQNYLDSK